MVTATTETTPTTEASEPELVETGEQRDALGRKRTPAGRRAQLLAAYRRSGQTQREFARAEGIRYTTFCTWAQAERRRGALPPAPAGGPRRAPTPPPIPAPAAAVPAMRFAEVDLPSGAWPVAAPAPAPALEARLPDGTVLCGGPAELAALLRALRD
jgi:transposase-like protein